jgi:beta-1,4-N-acetylglucosaminyltransferase
MSTQSALIFVLAMFFAILTLSIARFLWILPMVRTQHRSPRKSSAKVVIVLGSGGHTAEMLRLIEPLDFDKYSSRIYVVSSGDTLSEGKARNFELRKQGIGDKKVSHCTKIDFSFMI